jgi:hypothetical protein
MAMFHECHEVAYNAAPVGLVAEFALKAGAEAPEVAWLYHEGFWVANPHHEKKELH